MSTDYIKLERKEDYPFYNEQAEEGKMVITAILELPDGKKERYCDPVQLNKEGKYRTPKVNTEMIKAKIKQRQDSADAYPILVEHAREQEQKVADLTQQLAEQQQKFIDYQLQTEERFNKLALLLQQAPPPPEPAPLQAPPPLQSSKSLRQKSVLPK